MMMSMQVICHHHVYQENKSLFRFLFRVDCVCALALLAFNVWVWMLACMGSNTIEFCHDVFDDDKDD